ncbi:MAG: heavy metal translocating P-type ATPase [Pseudomonadota bacterium]
MPGAAPDPADRAAALAAAASDAVEELADGERRLTLVIENLECAACLPKIEAALRDLPGLIEGRVNLTTRRLRLVWQAEATELTDLLLPVLALGYRLAPFEVGKLEAQDAEERRFLLRCLAVSGFAAGNVMLLSVSVWSGLFGDDMGQATRDLLHWISALIALPAVAYAGRPFFRSAMSAVSAGRMNMDVPISLGVILASAMSLFETMRGAHEVYFDAAVTLCFFLLIGRILDRMMRGRARSAAENLLALKVESALVVRADGRRERQPISALQPGMRVAVAAGECLPVDGRVIIGRSSLDVSAITGESLPERVEPGAEVHAGTMNLDGSLEIEVTAAGERTLLAEVLRLVESAEQGRARYVRLADRAARIYAPFVHLLALAAFVLALAVGWSWQIGLMNAVAVLIVTCPCALGLATPAVQVAAVGRLLRAGVLVKSGDALERLAQCDHVVLDKTGTVTLGRPVLLNAAEVPASALRLAASLAAYSRHPLAQALVRAVGPVPLPDAEVREVPGAGLICQTPAGELRLGSAAHVSAEDDVAGADSLLWLRTANGRLTCFRFQDEVRPDAAEAVRALRDAGLTVELLSGDRAPVVAAVARQLGITDWHAGVDPAGKSARLAALAAEGRKVAMVGDGLNDAPALAAANASLSPAAASQASQVAADFLFQSERLGPVATSLTLSRRARRLVLQNFAIAIGYNLLAVPLAMAGEITPLLAALFMSVSSLVVTANALRAGRGGEPAATQPAAASREALAA